MGHKPVHTVKSHKGITRQVGDIVQDFNATANTHMQYITSYLLIMAILQRKMDAYLGTFCEKGNERIGVRKVEESGAGKDGK